MLTARLGAEPPEWPAVPGVSRARLLPSVRGALTCLLGTWGLGGDGYEGLVAAHNEAKQGRWGAARQRLQEHPAAPGDDPRIRGHRAHLLGVEAFLRGDPTAARGHFDEATLPGSRCAVDGWISLCHAVDREAPAGPGPQPLAYRTVVVCQEADDLLEAGDHAGAVGLLDVPKLLNSRRREV